MQKAAADNAATNRPEPADPSAGDDLPPPDTTRWVSSRKAQVVAAVKSGRLTFQQACKRWNLSVEELESWQSLLDRHGTKALRATRVQEYRAVAKRPR